MYIICSRKDENVSWYKFGGFGIFEPFRLLCFSRLLPFVYNCHLFKGLVAPGGCPEVGAREDWAEGALGALWGEVVVGALAWPLLLYVVKGKDVDLRPKSTNSFL